MTTTQKTDYDTNTILEQMRDDYWSGLQETRTTDTREMESYLTVMLGGECYGLNAVEAKEIFKLPKLVRVPKTPAFIMGIINLRGEIISVVDIRDLLNVPSTTKFDDMARVVLLQAEGISTGLVVEQVKEITSIPAESISPTSKAINKKDYFKGQAEYDEGLVIILDIPKFLTATEFKVGT